MPTDDFAAAREPLQIIPGHDAYDSLDDLALYPNPERGSERLNPFARVGHTPRFSIDHSDKVYAMGSCFAREIEKALSAAGLDVLSLEPRRTGEGLRHQHVVNNYNPIALRQDLEIALEGRDDWAEGFAVNIDAKERRWANYALGGGDSLKTGSREEVLAAHRRVLDAHRRIPECRMVVVTLGLVEVWFDKLTGRHLNIAPHRPAVRLHEGRFELHVMSFGQVLSELHRIRELLKKHAKVEQNIVLTVSPVPLHATFRGQDVLQANAYSKAVLRAAAETFVLEAPDVTYFPSFEFVSLTDRTRAFGSRDYRHVNQEMVDVIMDSTLRSYVSDLPPTKVEAQNLLKQRRYDELTDSLFAVETGGGNVPTFLRYYGGLALQKVGRIDEAARQLRVVVEAMPQHFAARVSLAGIHLENGEREDAEAVLREVPSDFQRADAVREALSKAASGPSAGTGPKHETFAQAS